jgi:hypothetical protein
MVADEADGDLMGPEHALDVFTVVQADGSYRALVFKLPKANDEDSDYRLVFYRKQGAVYVRQGAELNLVNFERPRLSSGPPPRIETTERRLGVRYHFVMGGSGPEMVPSEGMLEGALVGHPDASSSAASSTDIDATSVSSAFASPVAVSPGPECVPLAAPPRTRPRDFRAKAPFVAKMRYPALTSGDAVVDAEANAIIGGDLHRHEDEFVANGNDLLASERGDGRTLSPERIDDDVECVTTIVTPALVSVACVEKSFMDGPYVNTSYVTYNVALCAGMGARRLSLDSLCSAGAYCKRRIAEWLAGALDAGRTAAVDVDLGDDGDVFTRFAVQPRGLRFFVEQEIPHVLGHVPPVDVPFAKLTDVLRHDGPLAGLL